MPFVSQSVEGVILSGSPYSVYDKGAPHADPAVFELGVPILGICYGLQVNEIMARNLSLIRVRKLHGHTREKLPNAIIENMATLKFSS